MQNTVAQKFTVMGGQKILITPLRVLSFRPSAWERVRGWARRTLTEESLVEGVLVVATFSVVGGLFFGLYQALQNYSVISWP